MRVFCTILSLQAGIISLLASLSIPLTENYNLFSVPDSLSMKASLITAILLIFAGLAMVFSKKSDLYLFLALVCWTVGLIMGLILSPSFSGIFFRPISCVICLFIGLFVYTDPHRHIK